MTATPVIRVDGLVKRYGDKVAVNDLSFSVAAGEVYGLLGVNGAGKTTTIEILEGHRRRDGGAVEVLGVDPAAADSSFRDRIGIVLQASGVERKHTVREVLDLYRACYSNPRQTDECLGLLGLEASADKRVESLSGGQRRRVDFALGVIGRPELLFLDEPTTGFDPSARRASWELIRSLGDEGTTVVLTSHYLDEIEHLAHRVGVIAGGRMTLEDTTANVLASAGFTRIRFGLPADTSLADVGALLAAHLDAAPTLADDGRCELRTTGPTAALAVLTGWAAERSVELAGLDVGRPSLEDLFIDLTANEATSTEASASASASASEESR